MVRVSHRTQPSAEAGDFDSRWAEAETINSTPSLDGHGPDGGEEKAKLLYVNSKGYTISC